MLGRLAKFPAFVERNGRFRPPEAAQAVVPPGGNVCPACRIEEAETTGRNLAMDGGRTGALIDRAEPAFARSDLPARRPSRAAAEAAVRTLIEWAGDDPSREGLRETPGRVARAFEEFFQGYEVDPAELLQRTFAEVEGYDEMVVLRGIPFESHCEHHLVPIIGRAHVAYLPAERVVGISKLARLVEAYAKRLQIQERMTAQIANTLEAVLRPRGVGVVIEAAHQCMTTRGVHKPGGAMVTSRMIGAFRSDPATRREFLSMIGGGPGVDA